MSTRPSASGTALAEASGESTLQIRGRLLLVTGTAGRAEALQAGLERFHVDVVPDAEGVGVRVRDRVPFDVVLVDAARPGLSDALAVARMLRRCGNDAPAVLLVEPEAGADVASRGLSAGLADIVALTPGWARAPELPSRLLGLARRARTQDGLRPATPPSEPASEPGTVRRGGAVASEARVDDRLVARLDESLRSLECAHARLQDHAEDLARVLRASTDLRTATSASDLAERVLLVLADVPGVSLVAIGLLDREGGRTEVSGLALKSKRRRTPLGRRTVLMDLFNLSPHHERVGASRVVDGWSVSVSGEAAGAPAPGDWDLADLFDGAPLALTPVRGAGRFHGCLILKAASRRERLDDTRLGVVEILANVAGVALDNLEIQDGERRRAEWGSALAGAGRALLGVEDARRVQDEARRALAGAIPVASVSCDFVLGAARPAASGGFLARARLVADGETGAALPRVAAGRRLVVPVRDGAGLRALLVATGPAAAFADVDEAAATAFGEVAGKALASAEARAEERRATERLRLIAEAGRLASNRLSPEDLVGQTEELLLAWGCESVDVALDDGTTELRRSTRTRPRSPHGDPHQGGAGATEALDLLGLVARSGATAVRDVRRGLREAAVPLLAAGGLLGAVRVTAPSGRLRDEDLVAVASAADHVARGLHVARLFAELLEKNRALRESERNKTEILSAVAHDLRTPLASVRSAVDIVATYEDEGPEVRGEFVDLIRDETARLERLVEGFIVNAHLEEGSLGCATEPVRVPDLIDDVVRAFAGPLERARLAVERDVPRDLPAALADRERLGQVLTNLMSNAIRHSDPGGTVTVRAAFEPPGGALIPAAIRIDVADRGPGIEESQRDCIFQRFTGAQDRRVRGGAGLGLPVARMLAEHVGGRLWFTPRDGGGSVFSVAVPATGGGGDARRR